MYIAHVESPSVGSELVPSLTRKYEDYQSESTIDNLHETSDSSVVLLHDCNVVPVCL